MEIPNYLHIVKTYPLVALRLYRDPDIIDVPMYKKESMAILPHIEKNQVRALFFCSTAFSVPRYLAEKLYKTKVKVNRDEVLQARVTFLIDGKEEWFFCKCIMPSFMADVRFELPFEHISRSDLLDLED